MKRLVLVDGNALLHRAYHATPPLTTSRGELVNGVYGFSSMILKALSDLKPDFLAIAWDESGPTFRHAAYTQYKATRGPADEGLSSQYERVYQVCSSLNIPEFRLAGYEADDLIGSLVRQAAKEKNLEVIILTGDRDIMQLISKKVKVLMPRKTLTDAGLYGVEEFVSRYGFSPQQLIDFKALSGDQSDNIPGVPGIGEVTATKLVREFNSVEKLYQGSNLKTLPQRLQTLLAEGAESAVLSKKLVTLDISAPIKLDLKKCLVHNYNRQEVIRLFEELEFKSLISRLPGNSEEFRKLKKINKSGEQVNRKFDISGDSESFRNTQNSSITQLDLDVEEVLQKMSKIGVLIDLKFLNRLGKDLKGKLTKLEKQIYSKVGHQFNLNSPKQLSVVLFDELNLPVIRKTKTGRSTDEATLRELSVAHPVVFLLLEYRQLFKLVSTYIDALPRFVGKEGRIHSTFNVEGSATGRISSQNPNLQNIPVKGQVGSELRKAFTSLKGKVLLAADYSQIELRILAHLSGDPNLKKAFEQGLDIHSATAAKIFKVPIDKVTREQRYVAKTMNFATLYGQGAHALSQQLKVDYATARQYIVEYFEEFPKVREWMGKILEKGYKDGFVETIWGRRRHIPELQAQNRMLKAAGERAAVNHPIQGSSADMIKKAMIEVDKALKGGKCQLILQVHDELLFECHPQEVKEIAKIVKEKMENALKLSVPVMVDLKVGKNWGAMKPLSV